jgi:hypothetical protein
LTRLLHANRCPLRSKMLEEQDHAKRRAVPQKERLSRVQDRFPPETMRRKSRFHFPRLRSRVKTRSNNRQDLRP